LIRIGPSAFARRKSLIVIVIRAVVETIQDGASRGGRDLERSLMDHNCVLDFGDTVSMIIPAAFWQI
jgi:hypothetical protein